MISGETNQPEYEGYDLLNELGLELQNEELMADVVSQFDCEEFVEDDYWAGAQHERMFWGWERFKYMVKHWRRYTFSTPTIDTERFDEFPPNEILSTITKTLSLTGISTTVEVGKRFWRVRLDDGTCNSVDAFTSPPEEFAIYSNRMSPAGIPMFYGADEFRTAVRETVERGKPAIGIQFENLIPLNLLDLTMIPELGMFSLQTREQRQAIKFLESFRKDISRRVSKKNKKLEHIEYVPTQVLTEFIRHEHKTHDGKPFHGIKYPSSIDGKGCYVLFAEQYDCLPAKLPSRRTPQILRAFKTRRRFKNGSV